MTREEEELLRSAYAAAIGLLRAGDEIAFQQNYDAAGKIGLSAVIVVRGEGTTFDVIRAVEKVMTKLRAS